jgi:hypothetical protein
MLISSTTDIAKSSWQTHTVIAVEDSCRLPEITTHHGDHTMKTGYRAVAMAALAAV